jgi:hypothetical protein
MNDYDYLNKLKINNVSIADTSGKILNFSDLKIVTIVITHNIKIDISLNEKSLFIGGMEEFINPYL